MLSNLNPAVLGIRDATSSNKQMSRSSIRRSLITKYTLLTIRPSFVASHSYCSLCH